MGKAKHTPGRWEAKPEECDRPYIRIRGTRAGLRYKIANVLTPTHEGVHPREAEETRANARLIAELPELLDLLNEIDEYLSPNPANSIGCGSILHQKIRAVIKRVTTEV